MAGYSQSRGILPAISLPVLCFAMHCSGIFSMRPSGVRKQLKLRKRQQKRRNAKRRLRQQKLGLAAPLGCTRHRTCSRYALGCTAGTAAAQNCIALFMQSSPNACAASDSVEAVLCKDPSRDALRTAPFNLLSCPGDHTITCIVSMCVCRRSLGCLPSARPPPVAVKPARVRAARWMEAATTRNSPRRQQGCGRL